MNCGKCNQPLAPNAQFCGNCGTPVLWPQAAAAQTSASVEPAAASPIAPPPTAETLVNQQAQTTPPVSIPQDSAQQAPSQTEQVVPPAPVAGQMQQSASPPTVAAPAPLSPTASIEKPAFFRRYWWFAAIFLLLTPIIGLAILFTGEIYKKSKTTQKYEVISAKEKSTLTIVLVVFAVLTYGRIA